MRRLLTAAVLAGALSGAALVTAPAHAAAVTYYVDCSAKVAGDGSQAAPWNSVAAIRSHGAYYPGEQILLRRGTTCIGRLMPTGSGIAGAPVVLGAYGSGAKPTVSGNGTGNLTATVQLVNQPYWTIQDLHVTNSSRAKTTSSYRSAVLIRNSWGGRIKGVTVQRLTVDDVVSNMSSKKNNPREWGGISIITNGVKNDGFDGLQVLNNSVSHVGRTGVIVENNRYPHAADTGLRVSGNRISWTRGDGLIVAGARKGIVDHNTIAHTANEWPCTQCGKITPLTANAGLWTIKSSGMQLEYNEVYGTKRLGGDGEGIDVDASATDTVVQYNYLHDNQGGGILFCGATRSTARFNILENNQLAAFSFYGRMPSRQTWLYNNTVYAAKSADAKVVRTFRGIHGSKVLFKNNLVYSYGTGDYQWPTTQVTTSANTIVGRIGSGHPHDSRTSTRNPGLKSPGSGRSGLGSLNGYKPRHPGSFPKGVAIPASAAKDFFGKRIDPKHPPRGAAG